MKKSLPQDQQNESSSFSVDQLVYAAQIEALKTSNDLLVKQNVGYSQTVDQLLAQIEQKTNEIRHLQDLLETGSPIIGSATPFSISDEEFIADTQLKNLKATAMQRDLTLDETKRFDLLVKNKRLARGDSTQINGDKKSSKKALTTPELILLAKQPITKEE